MTFTVSSSEDKRFILSPYFDVTHVVIFTVLAMLAFLPYLLIFYPGVVEIDTVFQMAMFEGYGFGTMGEGTFTKLFPLFCSLVFGGLFNIGSFIGGSQTDGVFCMTFFQALGIAFAFAFSACYLSKWKVPAGARWVVFALSVLLPVIPIMAIDVGKDSLFVASFVPFCVCLAEAIRKSKEGEEMTWRWSIAAFLFATISSLATSKGFLVIGASFVLAIIICWKNKSVLKACCGVLASTVVIMAAVSLLISPALVIQDKMNVREVMSTPIQQVTYAVKAGAEITDEEREKLSGFYDLDAAVRDYNPRMTDDAKVKMDLHATDEQISDFMSTYISIGLRNPGKYWKATKDLLYTFWTPGEYNSTIMLRFLPDGEHADRWAEYNITKGDGTDLPNDFATMKELISDDMVIYAANKLPQYAESHPDFGDWNLNNRFSSQRISILCFIIDLAQIPVIGLLVQKPLYAVFLPFLMVLATLIFACKRRIRTLVLIMPLLLSAAFVFASPGDLARYVYPCLAACFLYVPLVVVECVNCFKTRKGEDRESI